MLIEGGYMLTLTLSAVAIKIPAIILILLVICFCSRAALKAAPEVLKAAALFKAGAIEIHTAGRS